MARSHSSIEFSVLVDILSNMAGMMILLACMALLIRQDTSSGEAIKAAAKPISFPLAYIPDKRSITLCLRYGQLYTLPEGDVLQAITEQARGGEPVQYIDLEKDGVEIRAVVTPTATGFRFMYRIKEEGGIPLRDARRVAATLKELLSAHPTERFFVVVHTWPDSVDRFRDIREFLHEGGMEVGWMPHADGDPDRYDIVYSIGEYDQGLSSIKAQ